MKQVFQWEVTDIEYVTHLTKDEVAVIIAKYFNTTTNNVFINHEIDLMKYGTAITDNYSEKPLAIVRRYNEELECRRSVEKYSERTMVEQLQKVIHNK